MLFWFLVGTAGRHRAFQMVQYRRPCAFGNDSFIVCRSLSVDVEQGIQLHQAAKNAFDEMGVKKLPKVKDLQAEYAKLLEEKKKTYAEYRRSREEVRELLTAKANVDRLLKMDEEQKKEQEKDHGQR